MTTNTTIFPGFYSVDKILIYPDPNSDQDRKTINIRNIVSSIKITESILNDCIRGVLNIVDASGMLELYPIRGEEKIYLEIKDALNQTQEYYGYVYKVDNVASSDANDKLTYTLHFVSYQRVYSEQYKITTSYADPIHDIVQNVFNKYYKEKNSSRVSDTNKDIIFEETDGFFKCLFPKYTPLQALKFLESRSYSSKSPTSSFRFFERTDAFYFTTDEFLFRKAIKNNSIKTFTTSDFISQSGDTFLARMSNLVSLENSVRFDTMEDIHSGAYKTKVITLDIANKTANLKDKSFNYNDVKKSFFMNTDDNTTDKHSDNFTSKMINDVNARQFVIIKDYLDDTTSQMRSETYFPTILTNRLSYMKHLNSIKVTGQTPGRFDLTCGDIINLDVSEIYTANPNKKQNKQLSGLYIIETINRTFNEADKFTNEYVLLKRNWSEA